MKTLHCITFALLIGFASVIGAQETDPDATVPEPAAPEADPAAPEADPAVEPIVGETYPMPAGEAYTMPAGGYGYTDYPGYGPGYSSYRGLGYMGTCCNQVPPCAASIWRGYCAGRGCHSFGAWGQGLGCRSGCLSQKGACASACQPTCYAPKGHTQRRWKADTCCQPVAPAYQKSRCGKLRPHHGGFGWRKDSWMGYETKGYKGYKGYGGEEVFTYPSTDEVIPEAPSPLTEEADPAPLVPELDPPSVLDSSDASARRDGAWWRLRTSSSF